MHDAQQMQYDRYKGLHPQPVTEQAIDEKREQLGRLQQSIGDRPASPEQQAQMDRMRDEINQMDYIYRWENP